MRARCSTQNAEECGIRYNVKQTAVGTRSPSIAYHGTGTGTYPSCAKVKPQGGLVWHRESAVPKSVESMGGVLGGVMTQVTDAFFPTRRPVRRRRVCLLERGAGVERDDAPAVRHVRRCAGNQREEEEQDDAAEEATFGE